MFLLRKFKWGRLFPFTGNFFLTLLAILIFFLGMMMAAKAFKNRDDGGLRWGFLSTDSVPLTLERFLNNK